MTTHIHTKSLNWFFALILISATPSFVFADVVWNQTLGKLMQVGESDIKVRETSEEQMSMINELMDAGEVDDAIKACDDFVNFFPNSQYIPDVLFKLGNLLEENEDYYEAFRFYQELYEKHPNNEYANRILKRQFDIGVKFMDGERFKVLGIPTVKLNSRPIEIFQTIKKNAPYHEYGEKAHLYLGMTYGKQGNLKEALQTYEDMLDEYPDTSYASDVSFRIANVVYKMSEITREKDKAIPMAQQKVSDHIIDYPKSESVASAKKLEKALIDYEIKNLYEIGLYYEDQKRVESALLYYRDAIAKGESTTWGQKAKARIDVLENPLKAFEQGKTKLEQNLNEVTNKLHEFEKLDETDFSEEEHKEIEEKQKDLEKRLKNYDKDILKEVEYRWEVLERKEKELSIRRKNLKKRKENLEPQFSEELKKSFIGWEEALQEQEFSLEREKDELIQISEEVGYERNSILSIFMPTIDGVNINELTNNQLEKIEELRRERAELTAEMDELFKRREKSLNQMKDIKELLASLSTEKGKYRQEREKGKDALQAQEKALEEKERELRQLLDSYEEKRKALKKEQGFWGFMKDTPGQMARASMSLLDVFGEADPEKKMRQIQDMKTAKKQEIEQLSEDIGEINKMIEKLEAIDTTAEQVQSTIEQNSGDRDERERQKEERQKRKQIKEVEKQINEQYRKIEDAQEAKKKFSEELEEVVKQAELYQGGVFKNLGKPFRSVRKGMRYFIYGMDDREKAVEAEAEKLMRRSSPGGERIEELKDEMALMDEKIKAYKKEIKVLYKKLDELRAAGGAGIFKSILIFPENVFKWDSEKKEDKDFLLKSIEKKETQKEGLRKDMEKLTAEEAKVENLMGQQKQGPPKEENAQEGSEIKEEVEGLKDKIRQSEREIKESRKEIEGHKKSYRGEALEKEINKVYSAKSKELAESMDRALDYHQMVNRDIMKLIGQQMKLLDDEESLDRKRLEKVEKNIEKYEGSASTKMKELKELRKEMFASIDQINTEKNRLMNLANTLETVN